VILFTILLISSSHALLFLFLDCFLKNYTQLSLLYFYYFLVPFIRVLLSTLSVSRSLFQIFSYSNINIILHITFPDISFVISSVNKENPKGLNVKPWHTSVSSFFTHSLLLLLLYTWPLLFLHTWYSFSFKYKFYNQIYVFMYIINRLITNKLSIVKLPLLVMNHQLKNQ